MRWIHICILIVVGLLFMIAPTLQAQAMVDGDADIGLITEGTMSVEIGMATVVAEAEHSVDLALDRWYTTSTISGEASASGMMTWLGHGDVYGLGTFDGITSNAAGHSGYIHVVDIGAEPGAQAGFWLQIM